MRRIDLQGQRFGRLAVLFQAEPPSAETKAYWRCACDCGNQVVVASTSLRHGRTRSCGCLRRERTSQVYTTHGATDSREYRAWQHAKRRCLDPRVKQYADYGGRGISMCDEWAHDFAAFLRDLGPCPPEHTVDRIDVNGHYEPGNCRWATRAEQSRNTRGNIYVTVRGRRMILADAADLHGVSRYTAYVRVKRGWDPLAAATLPPYQRP